MMLYWTGLKGSGLDGTGVSFLLAIWPFDHSGLVGSGLVCARGECQLKGVENVDLTCKTTI